MKHFYSRTVCNPRIFLTLALCVASGLLAIAGLANPSGIETHSKLTKAEPVWSVMPSPNADAEVNGGTNGMACISETDCFAVGYHETGTAYQTLIEHWNGSAWSVIPSPNTSPAQENRLNSVTCSSPTQCFAVGTYVGSNFKTLIERWDGTSWSILPSPNVGATLPNGLSGVACASETSCFAVGYSWTGTFYRTLILQWNGSSWAIVTSPNASTADNQLFGIACPSATQCFAVGVTQSDQIGGLRTLVERWNGSSWSIVSSPSAAAFDRLYSVTCTSETQCVAVGSSRAGTYKTLIEHWNGSSWSVVASPNVGTSDNYLYDVTCTSATDCFAVGKSFNGGQTLTERWNGSAWSIVSSPNSSGSTNGLAGVKCTSASNCIAVGSYYASFHGGPLLEHWNGSSWSIIPSGIMTMASNELNSVTCASADDCFAVGEYFEGNANAPLIQRWNGSSWSITPSPSTNPTEYYSLNGIACSSPTNCFLVGNSRNIHPYTFIEQWNGSAWSIVPSPNVGTDGSYLYAVTCGSATSCFAVGEYYTGFTYQTLIEQWNGASWSLVPSPSAGTNQNNSLYGVSCTSATHCVAVGEYYDGSFFQTIIEQWDGTAWVLTPSPNTSATQHNYLKGVSCTSANQCVAVGFYLNDGGFQTLIEQWDGNSWSIVASPTGSRGGSFLTGVTCASPTNCIAVGTNSNQALIERWDGISWTIAASPSSGALRANDLNGVGCASLDYCFAVGSNLNQANNVERTLIEGYSPAISSVVGAVSRKTHGNAGTFDLDLPLSGAPGIECRKAGATGTSEVDHKIVFNFARDLNSCGTSSLGTLTHGPAPTQCTLDLAGIADQQYLTITLNNVIDSEDNAGAVSITMGVLLGDVSGNGTVNTSDIGLSKALSGQPIDPATFRCDVNANGSTNATDIALVKALAGTGLP